MMHQQDRALDSISGTLKNLAQQAGLIGQEVGEHNECVSSHFWGHVASGARPLLY